MVITEADLRDQLRRPTLGATVVVPPGAGMTPAARDFVKQWRLELVERGAAARPATPATGGTSNGSNWDHPAQFPVDFSGEAPRCMTCGGSIASKPDALTQLNHAHFAPKTHPRIRLRGRFDSLNATLLMAAHQVREGGNASVANLVDSLAAYCRELLSAEYNERPVAELALDGLDAEAIHRATHEPKDVLGIDHLTLGSADDAAQHWLNIARTASRELEIDVLGVFENPHDVAGSSIVHAMNRLSSAVYYCQLRLAADSATGGVR